MSRILIVFLCATTLSLGALAADKEQSTSTKALAPMALKAPKSTPAMLKKGEALYTANCMSCHGEKGHGDGPAGMYMNPRPPDFGKTPFKQGTSPAHVFVTISTGVKNTMMMGWSHLPEADRWALAHYVLTMVPIDPGQQMP